MEKEYTLKSIETENYEMSSFSSERILIKMQRRLCGEIKWVVDHGFAQNILRACRGHHERPFLRVDSFLLSPDESKFAIIADNKMYLFGTNTGDVIAISEELKDVTSFKKFSSSGNLILLDYEFSTEDPYFGCGEYIYYTDKDALKPICKPYSYCEFNGWVTEDNLDKRLVKVYLKDKKSYYHCCEYWRDELRVHYEPSAWDLAEYMEKMGMSRDVAFDTLILARDNDDEEIKKINIDWQEWEKEKPFWKKNEKKWK